MGFDSDSGSKDGRDAALIFYAVDEEEYDETGGGNQFLGFMFGNVDNSGDLDVDYFDKIETLLKFFPVSSYRNLTFQTMLVKVTKLLLNKQMHLLPGMVDGLGSPLMQRRQLYVVPMSKLRLLMICHMAKPEEVLIVEDENGSIVCEMMKDNDVLVQYKVGILF
ncbi:hypothetical protein FNV43_RR14796 [Rhamnella rubrinervis]|uniref:Uncharacterized protein n=1 Tax=Rhamnella rubrinervis TaxID=2594499 RepID=A0A8K0MGS4_9ROSA|nr:hypothetical protein FNV43_RR14796 [Rhamnella rubrinervis]